MALGKRREGVAAGLTVLPPDPTYDEYVQFVLAAPVMREMAARIVEKGVLYAGGAPYPVEYHEGLCGGDRDAATVAADQDTLRSMMR